MDDERTNVFQRWESKEDLAAHILAEQAATPEPAPATPWLKREVAQYEVGAAEPLGKWSFRHHLVRR